MSKGSPTALFFKVGSMLRVEPKAGLEVTTLGSRHELRLRLRCLSDGTTQAPQGSAVTFLSP